MKLNLIKLTRLLDTDIFDFPIKDILVLNDSEKTLLCFLVDLIRDKESVLITKRELANQIGCKPMTIFRQLKVLEYWKYIEKQEIKQKLKISFGQKKRDNTTKRRNTILSPT